MIPNIPTPPAPLSGATFDSFTLNGAVIGTGSALNWNFEYNEGKVLELPENNGTNKDYTIYYQDQPFNYLDIRTIYANPVKLVIFNVPPSWWLVHNTGTQNITISPQIGQGVITINNKPQQVNPANDKLIGPESHNFVAIVPGSPPLVNSISNPSLFEMT